MKRCPCGHDTATHQHLRRGSDCALCTCTGYPRRITRATKTARRAIGLGFTLGLTACGFTDHHSAIALGLGLLMLAAFGTAVLVNPWTCLEQLLADEPATWGTK